MMHGTFVFGDKISRICMMATVGSLDMKTLLTYPPFPLEIMHWVLFFILDARTRDPIQCDNGVGEKKDPLKIEVNYLVRLGRMAGARCHSCEGRAAHRRRGNPNIAWSDDRALNGPGNNTCTNLYMVW